MTDIVPATAAQARALTDRIKVGIEGIWQLVKQAYQTQAWEALGYDSWDDYCTREFGTSRIRLPREERQEVVASLREAGMSTRAITAATGVDRKTVRRDLEQVEEMGPPGPDLRESDAEPPLRLVTGTDGKSYTPRTPVHPVRPVHPKIQGAMSKFLVRADEVGRAADGMSRPGLASATPEERAIWAEDLTVSMQRLQRLLDLLKQTKRTRR